MGSAGTVAGGTEARGLGVNILHVLSQHEVTGAETYAAALIAEQTRDGHRL